ncbi:hypothetical protein K2173_010895 [Erythroxylum novogranatense]|uniref:WRKY domain-containing protein n=1 Tax=Erythroxylum novogranatense TaxID=1862640 RepID=A0AAV8T0Z6_9ROSI|nr:hypothetical protein K2173_010895 [Erythroxylum novogranatense]
MNPGVKIFPTATAARAGASMEGEEEEVETREEHDSGTARLVLPEDGYEWRKYGQKYIQNIRKWRSYFRCQKQNCMAKKRVEWSTSGEADDVRVVYDGMHNHSQGPSNRKQYDLLSQVLRDQSTSSSSSSSSFPLS